MVAGAQRVSVACAEDADELVRRASACRAVESTAMNAVSSRSHSVFMLYISGQHEAAGIRVHGVLNLVDLAGRCVHADVWHPPQYIGKAPQLYPQK